MSSSGRASPHSHRTSSSLSSSSRLRSSFSSATSSTLSSVLTEERHRDRSRRSRYEGTGRGSYAAASSTGSASFSSSVLFGRLQKWGASCFTRQRGRDVRGGDADGRAKATAGPGGGGGSPSKRVDATPSRERAPAARLEAKPLRESTVPVEEAARGNPAARGRWKKASSRKSEIGMLASSAAGTLQRREAHFAGRGRLPTAAASAVTVTASVGVEKERAFVWADKYRPRALEDFICNRAVVAELRDMMYSRECDHFIFEGPPGVGKKTMISALLREVFGPEMSKTRDEVKVFALKGEIVPSIEANVKASSQHVEINLSDLRGYEMHAVAELIKGSPRSTSKNTMHCDYTNCQAIVLYEADKLSIDSQNYICWLMDKYKACFTMIFCCSDSSTLQPLKHLCKVIKLHPPSQIEIAEVLGYIAKNEGIDLPYSIANKIADNAKQNLRQAIRSFEASWRSSHSFQEGQEILTGWEEDIANIAKNIVEEQSPRQLYAIREKLKNLIEHNVSPHFIFSTLQLELKKHLEDNFHAKLDDICEEYKKDIRFILDSEKSMVLSQDVKVNMRMRNDEMRSFMRIEEFTAKFMSFYKSNVVKDVEGKNYCSL